MIHNQDCIEGMKKLPDESIDTVITDPPYGLSFMGSEWDSFTDNEALQKWTKQWSEEALRVAKPGAIMLCFGGTRTWHRIACGIEDAGWEIRDTIIYAYGTGFPKSHNIGKAFRKTIYQDWLKGKDNNVKKWENQGTALKPAWEPIIMAMKPYENTYAENALEYDVAGLNIDGARVGDEKHTVKGGGSTMKPEWGWHDHNMKEVNKNVKGRFPANLIHDSSEEVEACFPESKGFSGGGDRTGGFNTKYVDGKSEETNLNTKKFGDQGSASRYFKRIKYSAKASKKERNSHGKVDNNHPTVKPLALMQYLVELTKMPNEDQIYLDPFIGSGTTAMAVRRKDRNYIGYEKEEEYVDIARARIQSIEDELI